MAIKLVQSTKHRAKISHLFCLKCCLNHLHSFKTSYILFSTYSMDVNDDIRQTCSYTVCFIQSVRDSESFSIISTLLFCKCMAHKELILFVMHRDPCITHIWKILYTLN